MSKLQAKKKEELFGAVLEDGLAPLIPGFKRIYCLLI